MKNNDIKNFLKESKTQENDLYSDVDSDGYYLYPEPIEFTENVLEEGCIHKRKKEIYDQYEW